MTDTIKAELVYYRIDVSRPEGRKAYAELCEDVLFAEAKAKKEETKEIK